MVAEQEGERPLVWRCVCGHPGEETPNRIFGREVLRHSGHKSRPRRGESVPVDLRFARAFANVLDRGVAIEDGLQVDVGPPSEQDRFGVMIQPWPLRAGEKCPREPDTASST